MTAITISAAAKAALLHERGKTVPAYGYVRKHFLMNASEVAVARRALVDMSLVHDLPLAAIYIEEVETSPDAFHHLLAAVMNEEHKVIIVPTLHHLAVIGEPRDVRKRLEENGISVLTARDND